MQKESEDTWISERFDVELSEMRILAQKSGWRGLDPDTSLDLLPCGLHVIRLPLTLPPGKHHSHPRPSHHLLSSLLFLHPHTLLHLFTWLLISDKSFCVPVSQRNPAATFQHHHLPRVFYVSITPANNFRRSQGNVMGRCSETDTLLLRSSCLWGRDLELQKNVILNALFTF